MHHDLGGFMKLKNKEGINSADIINKLGYDPFLLSKIQPQGGINFNKDDKFVKTGDGNVACIHVYEFPGDIDTHWLAKLCNIPHTIAVIDIFTDNIYEVKKNINKSMKEQNQRYIAASDFEEKHDAEQRFLELKTMYHELSSMGEVMKIIQVRIFSAEKTWKDTEEKIKELTLQLESDNYKSTVFLNEQKTEWKSLYQPYEEQMEEPFKFIGQPIVSEALAGGYPFHFASLEDPHGTLLGYTPCGGAVLFDEFTLTPKRTSYSEVVLGVMGSGKSTLLKKRMYDRAIRGDYVRVFDISGEFTVLTEELGGTVIKEGNLNPLEILRAGDNESLNYTLHSSKLQTMFQFWLPNSTQYERFAFEEVLRELYIKFDILPEGEINRRITGLPSEKYPILGDLLKYIDEKIKSMGLLSLNTTEEQVRNQDVLILGNVRKAINNVVSTYGYIFNKHTDIKNIQDKQVVSFDMSVLKNLKDNIFDAQFFNLFSLSWDNSITNGTIMKNEYELGQRSLEDVVHFNIIMDEAHRFINNRKLTAVDQITGYLRESRKFFVGFTFATHKGTDFVPDEKNTEGFDKMQTLFSLAQYKFIFNQDASNIESLNKMFSNQLSDSELERIPYLEQGENILVISGDQNIEFKVKLTKEEKEMFRGGA